MNSIIEINYNSIIEFYNIYKFYVFIANLWNSWFLGNYLNFLLIMQLLLTVIAVLNYVRKTYMYMYKMGYRYLYF